METPRLTLRSSAKTRTFRLCLGKSKLNKPCAKMVTGETLFCEYHSHQEDDYYAFQNPIFLDKCDSEIRKLGIEYGITDKRLKIETLKRQILEALMQRDKSEEFKQQNEQRRKLIETLNIEYEELQTEDEKLYFKQVVDKKNFKLSQIQKILDEIVLGQYMLVPDEQGQICSLAGNLYRKEYQASKHQIHPEDQIINKYVEGDYEYTETKILRPEVEQLVSSLVDEYYQLLKLQFEVLNRNIMQKNFNDVLKNWNDELFMKTNSQWSSLQQKVNLLLETGYETIIESQPFIPTPPSQYMNYCYKTNSYTLIDNYYDYYYEEKIKQIRYERFIELNAKKKNLDFWFTYQQQLNFAKKYFGSRDETVIHFGQRKDATTKEKQESLLEQKKDTVVNVGKHWFKLSTITKTINELKKMKDKSYDNVSIRFPDIIYSQDAYDDMMDVIQNEQ